MVTRFAPSPTGRLHLGHAYSAWLAWERAQEASGTFLLRLEDIDHTRVRERFYQEIEQDLHWLGIRWSGEPLRQLNRLAAYEKALQSLRDLGLVYPCFCTRKELAMSAPQQGDGVQLYAGTCRGLSASEREARVGQDCSWRLDMGQAAGHTGKLSFRDSRLGEVEVKPQILGDPVLARKDIATSYHLAVVVDDAAQKVTEIIRGEDLLESTHVHRVLQTLLGLPEPTYHHHRLVMDENGKRLAKRHDSLAIGELREQGWLPEKVIAWAKKNLSKSLR